MSKIVYDMNFHDVLKELFSIGGWFQGNAFQDGVFIKLTLFAIFMFMNFPKINLENKIAKC